MGSDAITWAVALVVILLALHGLWIRPDPSHQFILHLIEKLVEETNGGNSKQF